MTVDIDDLLMDEADCCPCGSPWSEHDRPEAFECGKSYAESWGIGERDHYRTVLQVIAEIPDRQDPSAIVVRVQDIAREALQRSPSPTKAQTDG